MKLRTLVKEIEIQGDIYLSIWDDYGEEVESYQFEYVDNFSSTLNSLENAKQLYRMKVRFVFSGGDGYLHIELV